MPYRLDLFAIFIFLGIVQAVFLMFFFFSPANRKNKANFFHGIMLFAMAACILEIFLMYSGYIVHCFYLVDFSEWIAFGIGPAFFLMVISLIEGNVQPKHYWHFVTPFIYLTLQLPSLLRGVDHKYNAWIYSYHPDLPFRAVSESDGRYFWVTNHASLLIIVSIGVYAILGLVRVINAFRSRKESFIHPVNAVLKKLRLGVLECVSVAILIAFVKAINLHDTGDHLVAAYTSVLIYITSFHVMKHSGFFNQAALAETQKKYKNIVQHDVQENTLRRLKTLMESEKPFKQASFSLPELAQRLGVSVHVLSQVINDKLGKSFFELIAEYRVREAMQLLKAQANIKVEEIAEQVGYLSKSSFNNAFKKITGRTPSDYRNNPD